MFHFRSASAHDIITVNINGSVTCFAGSEARLFFDFQGVSVDTFYALENKIQWTTFAFKQKYQSQFFNIRDFIFI